MRAAPSVTKIDNIKILVLKLKFGVRSCVCMEGRAIRRLDRVSPYRRCRGGCLSRNSYLRVSTRASTPTRTKAERARARCRSIQQKKFFPADRCRATVAKRSATLKQQSDIHIDRHSKISRRP